MLMVGYHFSEASWPFGWLVGRLVRRQSQLTNDVKISTVGNWNTSAKKQVNITREDLSNCRFATQWRIWGR